MGIVGQAYRALGRVVGVIFFIFRSDGLVGRSIRDALLLLLLWLLVSWSASGGAHDALQELTEKGTAAFQAAIIQWFLFFLWLSDGVVAARFFCFHPVYSTTWTKRWGVLIHGGQLGIQRDIMLTDSIE